MSQVIKFDVWTWRDIMRVCGNVVSKNDARKALQYIRIRCENNRFTAVGANEFQVSTIEGSCEMKELWPMVEILIQPRKIPVKTKLVELIPFTNVSSENGVKVHTLCFYDKDMNVTGSWNEPVIMHEYISIDRVIKLARDNIDGYNHGEGAYTIAVNPRYLIAALEGMTDCNAVILNFGSRVQPFMIRPYDREQDRTALVFPFRIAPGADS